MFVKETLCTAVGAALQVRTVEVPLFSKVPAFNGVFSLSATLLNVCRKLESGRIVWEIPDIQGKPNP
jgi:hypothetical protein